jgi:hypothetical protein
MLGVHGMSIDIDKAVNRSAIIKENNQWMQQ